MKKFNKLGPRSSFLALTLRYRKYILHYFWKQIFLRVCGSLPSKYVIVYVKLPQFSHVKTERSLAREQN